MILFAVRIIVLVYKGYAIAGFVIFAIVGADLVFAVAVGGITLGAIAEADLGASRGLVIPNAVKDVVKGDAITLKQRRLVIGGDYNAEAAKVGALLNYAAGSNDSNIIILCDSAGDIRVINSSSVDSLDNNARARDRGLNIKLINLGVILTELSFLS